MFSELSLLDAVISGGEAESVASAVPAADFTASLDYIDSLASRSALALSRRDLFKIATADLFAYSPAVADKEVVPGPTNVGFNLSTDFRPLGDARRYHPEGSFRPLRALSRSASEIVSPSFPAWSPKTPDLPPYRWHKEYQREADSAQELFRKARRPSPFAFKEPNRLVLCMKRKIRRQVLMSAGIFRHRWFNPPRFNRWSRVFC